MPETSAYKAAGVDIDAAARAKELIKPLAKSTARPEVIGGIGSFGGLFQVPRGFRNPVLVSSTDNIGTKVRVAAQAGMLDWIGIDVVNQNVNDVLVCGAEPLFFLDYISLEKMDPGRVETIVRGVAQACREAGCALIGGETAEQPGLYKQGEFDLAGFIVGIVEKDAILDGSKIVEGDILLGIASSGLHTNGYSLARQVFRTDEDGTVLQRVWPELGRPLAEVLLAPHRAYHPLLKPALPYVHGMAHITGGGLVDNIPRVLPDGLGCEIRRESWQVPPIFKLIQRIGEIDQAEMDRVFNQGIGMVLMVSPGDVAAVTRIVPEAVSLGAAVRHQGGARVRFI